LYLALFVGYLTTLSIIDHTPLKDTVTENWSWQNFGAIPAWELVMAQFGCYRSIFQDRVWNCLWHNSGAIQHRPGITWKHQI